jgi:hypothetical protein
LLLLYHASGMDPAEDPRHEPFIGNTDDDVNLAESG